MKLASPQKASFTMYLLFGSLGRQVHPLVPARSVAILPFLSGQSITVASFAMDGGAAASALAIRASFDWPADTDGRTTTVSPAATVRTMSLRRMHDSGSRCAPTIPRTRGLARH